MTGGSEDERDWTNRITLPMMLAPVTMCIGLCGLNILLSNFPLKPVMAGSALAGVGGYGLFIGLKWLTRRSRPAAVVVLLSIIGAIVFLWPTACVVQGGKPGSAVQHYCRCEGLTVASFDQNSSHPRSISYCFGLEIEDVWEEPSSWPSLN